MRTARVKGFDVVLVYIGTEDVEITWHALPSECKVAAMMFPK